MTSLATTAIHTLGPAHIPGAVELSSIAGWNQTLEDWCTLLELAPDGCFGIEVDNRIVATTTLLVHNPQVAWIGMVLTHPDFRRQGLARQLIGRALDHAARLKIRTIKLDATDEGRPLYESFGFRPEQAIERWVRTADTCDRIAPSTAALPGEIGVLDSAACGYDRFTLLRTLAPRSQTFIEGDAYLFCRPGRVNSYLGPCVAEQSKSARRLVSQALRDPSRVGCFWDVLPENREAVALARDFGFVPERRLNRMVLGDDLRGREEWIYAIAGFELG